LGTKTSPKENIAVNKLKQLETGKDLICIFFNQQKPNGRSYQPTHPLSLLWLLAGWFVARFGKRERERDRVSAELNLQRWVCYPRN